MNKWIDLSKQGIQKEEEFGTLLTTQFGGTVKKASREEDMYNHIDLYWELNGKTYSYDVKSAKKNSRADNKPNYDINWIELKNVRGNKGWLFGKADYIAFECENDWIICRRTDIINLIDLSVVDQSISKSKDFYTYYQRDGRKDIIVKVPTDDLRKIARKIFNKNILV